MKFSVCVEIIFSDLPFLERLERVREAGASAFEFWSWKEKDIDAIDRKRKELGLISSSFTIPSRLPSLTVEGVKDQFYEETRSTLDVAGKLECKFLIAPVGLGMEVRNLSRERQLANAVKNLKAVAPMLEDSDVTMVIEPVNMIDHRGCFLSRCEEGFQLIRGVGSPNVKLLYDFYHQQITEGNLIENTIRNFDLIGLFHVGDVPGRHEPGTGEINYRNIFKSLEMQGYEGYISLEFIPTVDHVDAVRQTIKLTVNNKIE